MITVRSCTCALLTLTLACNAINVHALSKAGAAPQKFQSLDKMVAIVNNDTITGSELDYQTNLLLLRLKQNETELPPMAEFKKQILERMILEKIQLQLASETGIEIDNTTLNQTLNDIASRDGMPLAQMREFLEEQGIPFDYFRDTVKKELTLSKLQQKEIGQQIAISKTDIEHFLHSPQGQDKTGSEYRLGHILVALPEAPTPAEIQKAKLQVEDLKKQLAAGANFQTLAMSQSAGPQALNGGDLGWKKGTELPTLFAKQTLSMAVHEVQGPIRNAGGFHLIKLLEKRTPGGVSTESAKPATHVRQILIKNTDKISDSEAKKRLTDLRNRILKGAASFAKIAEQYSEEPGSSVKGGDLGWVTEQSLIKPFYSKMTSLKTGELSEPFKTELGWHLIQVIERKMQKNTSEAMRAKATEILYQRKFEEQLTSWLKRIRQDAEIKIY